MKTVDKLEVIEEMLGSLPEAPEGKKLVGILWLRVTHGDTYLDPTNSQWTEWTPINMSADKVPVAIFQYKPKKVKRTTLADLVGDDCTKPLFVTDSEGSWHQYFLSFGFKSGRGKTYFRRLADNDTFEIVYFHNCGWRWSHSPFTPYKEANKFVV